MALTWYKLEENIGTRTLEVNLTLNSLFRAKESYVGEPYYIPKNGNIGNVEVIFANDARFIFHTEACAHNSDPMSSGPPDIVEWVLVYGAFKTMYASTSGTTTCKFRLTGTINRYVALDIKASDAGPWKMGMDRQGNAGNIMGITELAIKDVMDNPTVHLELGSQVVEYATTYTEIESSQISIEAIAGPYWSGTMRKGGLPGQYIPPSQASYSYSRMPTAIDSENFTWVSGTYSRSSDGRSVAGENRAFDYSYDIPVGADEYANGWLYLRESGSRGGRVFATCGGGVISVGGGYRNCCATTANDGTWLEAVGVSFTDTCGAYSINVSNDIANMDEVARAGYAIQGLERYPAHAVSAVAGAFQSPCTEVIEHQQHTYSFDGTEYLELQGLTNVTYGGWWTTSVWGCGAEFGNVHAPIPGGVQEYFDLPQVPQDGFVFHGFDNGQLGIVNLPDTWDEQTQSYQDGVLGEPSHPGWTPLPTQAIDEETGQPLYTVAGEPIWDSGVDGDAQGDPWWDNEIFLKVPSVLNWVDALRFYFAAPGDIPNPPVVFKDITGWEVPVNVTVAIDEDAQRLTLPADKESGYLTKLNTLPDKLRLTGTRFAKVNWKASVAGAKAKVYIGKHAWELTATAADTWMHTLIDLCRPDIPGDVTVAGPSDQQSIAPYELPLDTSYVTPNDPTILNKRNPDETAYLWEYPAGWGVGRVRSLKLEVETPGTAYWFASVGLYRKTYEEGGFAKLYVLPHQPSWNDSRRLNDFGWQYAGEAYTGHSEKDTLYAIRKWLVVVDGAVVLEGNAGYCTEQNNPPTGAALHPGPWYPYTPLRMYPGVWSSFAVYARGARVFYEGTVYKCIVDHSTMGVDPEGSAEWEEAIHPIAWPLDDYTDSTEYATNGVVNVVQNPYIPSDWHRDYGYLTWLEAGVYNENTATHQIAVSIKPLVNRVRLHVASGVTGIGGLYKRFRGQVQGLLWNQDGTPASEKILTVSTPNSSQGHSESVQIATNLLGWYETKAFNVKGSAYLSNPLVDVPLRSRFISRLCGIEQILKYALLHDPVTGYLHYTAGGYLEYGPYADE
jgi:hypothetical protein